MIRVLVVEDSPVVQEFLVHILSSDPDIWVIGTANNGEEALEAVKRKKPDIITMDINMPKMNGLEATRKIMESLPTPIVIVSGSWDTKEVATTFRAMEAGALAIVPRPMGIGHPDYEATAKELIQTVKLMSEVKVVRRWPRRQLEAVVPTVTPPVEVEPKRIKAKIRIVAIGASTGGPIALQTILSGLPKDFPAPVLIVQHIAEGFVQGLVEWLDQTSNMPVYVATHGEYILPGHIYIAPDKFHISVKTGGRIALSKGECENGLRPSVSYLFRSIANVYGQNAAAVLLTGMGKDGAKELKLLKEKGAVTIAQDKESSVVHGMPGEAIRLGAATYILSPEKIPAMFIKMMNKDYLISNEIGNDL
ncbi:MAG: chemotaxis response regulator protein-glutamate methylesterase [Candidatus Cloacimonetes bacterium]|nr:chemotaxis response regulator protein-glutamate methylesterase [Candidatus Cloacimonadota bacterium]